MLPKETVGRVRAVLIEMLTNDDKENDDKEEDDKENDDKENDDKENDDKEDDDNKYYKTNQLIIEQIKRMNS
jgi:ABC-type Zn2+ transport system substrate-binding protein/surface adhesin